MLKKRFFGKINIYIYIFFQFKSEMPAIKRAQVSDPKLILNLLYLRQN